jgi:hypothetical protein
MCGLSSEREARVEATRNITVAFFVTRRRGEINVKLVSKLR